MLAKDLPTCPFCMGSDFNPGGGHLGGALSQQGFTCTGCGHHIPSPKGTMPASWKRLLAKQEARG